MEKYVYFSVSDRQLENFFEQETTLQDAFEKSLLLNSLFQQGIVIPDIFCFISTGLGHHIKKSGTKKTLLEACVESNILIPAFRYRSVSSFPEALNIVRGKGDPDRAIQGLQEDAEEIAYRLQIAADANPSFSPMYWPPHDVGEQFDKVVEKYLVDPELPDIDPSSGINMQDLEDHWRLTENWRTDCIRKAREETKKIAGKGLRRGEIMNAVGRSLGLPEDHKVNDVKELFSLPKSPKKKRAIKLFCRWMTECYQYNQATELGCTPNFPCFDALNSLMTISVLPQATTPTDLNCVPIIREKVAHPPFKVLLDISPTELLKVRQDLGLGYFAAVAAWQQKPNVAKAQEVRRTLRKYAEELVKWTSGKRNINKAILEVTHVAKTTRNRQLLTTALNLLKILPIVKNFIVLSEEGFSNYQIYRPSTENSEIELNVPTARMDFLPEVNLPQNIKKIKEENQQGKMSEN